MIIMNMINSSVKITLWGTQFVKIILTLIEVLEIGILDFQFQIPEIFLKP